MNMNPNLSRTVFAKGVVVLRACVRGLEADEKTVQVWYELLSDLNEADYLNGMREICRTEINIYPGTNIIALIRGAADAAKRARLDARTQPRQLYEGYTQKQFDEGRDRLRIIFDKLNTKRQ